MEAETIQKNGANPKSLMSWGIIISIFLFIVFSTTAQDIITLRNGEDLQALVQEVGDVDIRYKKFDNPEGPVYTMKKSEIFMIRYTNGSKDVFSESDEPPVTRPTTPESVTVQSGVQNRVSFQNETALVSLGKGKISNINGRQLKHDEIRTLMNADQMALATYNRGVSNKSAGKGLAVPSLIFCGLSLVCSVTYLATPIDERDPNLSSAGLAFLGAAWVFLIPSAILSSSGNKKIASSVGIYNNSIQQHRNQTMSLNFGITQSGGIGLALIF